MLSNASNEDSVLDDLYSASFYNVKAGPRIALQKDPRIFCELLQFKNAGKTLERTRLLENIWEQSVESPSRSLDTHLRRLRVKLGDYGDTIRTVRSKGYRFVPPGVKA